MDPRSPCRFCCAEADLDRRRSRRRTAAALVVVLGLPLAMGTFVWAKLSADEALTRAAFEGVEQSADQAFGATFFTWMLLAALVLGAGSIAACFRLLASAQRQVFVPPSAPPPSLADEARGYRGAPLLWWYCGRHLPR